MKLATFKIMFIVDEQNKRIQSMKIKTIEKYIKYLFILLNIKDFNVSSEFKNIEEVK